jgi:hypothetical protein
MRRAERSTEPHQDDRDRAGAPAAPLPPVLALQQAGVGNRALSRWLLQREQTYEQAAAEQRGMFAYDDVLAELADWEPGVDPMDSIGALDRKRAKIDARLLAGIQQDVLTARRAQDDVDRAGLEARAAGASTALDVAHTGAASALKTCKLIQADHQKYPFMAEADSAAKASMEAAKKVADDQSATLTPLGAAVKTARKTLADALGSAARTAAVTDADSVAKDVAAKATAASTALAPHLEALTKLTTRATGEERQAAKEAALALGLPANLANKILSADVAAPKADIEQRLTQGREDYQSLPGPTIVTRAYGMGVAHGGAATAGIDRIGSVNGKNVHLTLYWDQVQRDPILLTKTDAEILSLTLGSAAMGCMHVTAEAWGKADNRNPSYYWSGAKKNMVSAAPRVGVTAAELESQLQALCEAQIARFKLGLEAVRSGVGARVPAPAPPPA